jgi:hypothetical protein
MCTKEKIMKTSDLFKVVPVAAIALSVYSTSALAGATNQTENMDTPTSASDVGGSGSAGGTGSSDVDANSYRSPNSSANPGAGSTPENADSGYDLSTGNTSGSSTGAKDSSQ